MEGGDIVKTVAEKTNSELILFFVLVVVVVVIGLIPYLRYKSKKDLEKALAANKAEMDRIKLQAGLENNQFQSWTEREKNLLQVIKENGDKSEQVAKAITGLTTVLSVNNKACDVCKDEQTTLWKEARKDIKEVRDMLEALGHQFAAGSDGHWSQLQQIIDQLKKKE